MKKMIRAFALMLSFMLIATILPAESTILARAERVLEAAMEEPAQDPTEEPAAEPNEESTLPLAEVPTEAPTATPSEAPTEAPMEAPTEEPTLAPTDAAGEPTLAPTGEPLDSPTPAPADTSAPALYAVSPAEATFELGGGKTSLEFAITPSDAPFVEVEGLESEYENGVVTIGAMTLSALGVGEHKLVFKFADGTQAEALVILTDFKPVSKGAMTALTIGGTAYDTSQLAVNIVNAEQHWSWSVADETLTLDGYDGSEIRGTGAGTLKIALASDSSNKVNSASKEGSIYASSRLTISGDGALEVANSNQRGISAKNGITIQGGNITVTKAAFFSENGGIYASGGTIKVKHENHTGIGFSSSQLATVDGATITVEGAAVGIVRLGLVSGSVTIKDCDTGIANGVYGTGGTLTIKDTVHNAIQSDYGLGFENSTVSITGCGQYGIVAYGGIEMRKGAKVTVQAKQVAVYVSDSTAALVIDKGAYLDLSGGESAIKAPKTLIDGKRYTGKYNHVIIQNGAVVRQENALFDLTIDGVSYGVSDVSGDLSGSGWTWTAAAKTLAFTNYQGGSITAIGGSVALVINGSSTVSGDVTVSDASVTGDGEITASRFIAKGGFEVKSGSISAMRLSAMGDVKLSGGTLSLSSEDGGYTSYYVLSCANFTATGGTLTMTNPGHVYALGLNANGKISIGGGTISVQGAGDVYGKSGVAISDGTITIQNSGIVSNGNISVSGGNVTITDSDYAMSVGKGTITISGKATLHLESQLKTAFDAKTVKIAGKTYAPRYPGVVIENGKLVDAYKILPDLVIGGSSYFMKDLNGGDLKGDGWSWSAKKNTLTLSGYGGNCLWINREMTVALAAGTSNSAVTNYSWGNTPLHSVENLTLTGTGRWSGEMYFADSLKITGSPNITADSITAEEGISISGGRIRVSGDLYAHMGAISISNSSVTARQIEGNGITINKSTVVTTCKGDEDDPDVSSGRKLTVSNSLLLCTVAGSDEATKVSGSLVFLRYEENSEEFWVLVKSATISRDMTLPIGRTYVVPVGISLKIASGKKLYVYGDLLVGGKVSGKVVLRREAERIDVYGSASVAKGKSVPLTAKVVPVLSDGDADQAVSWSSSKPWLLSVNDKGVVTATTLAQVGDTADVTCTALDGSGVTTTVTVTVTTPVAKVIIRDGGGNPVSKLTASRSLGSIELDSKIDPDDASPIVKWASSNSSIASVDPDEGTVTLRKKGTVTITCTAQDGSGVKATLKLTVT